MITLSFAAFYCSLHSKKRDILNDKVVYFLLRPYLFRNFAACKIQKVKKMDKENLTIFDQNVIEFVTVAASYCNFIEQAEGSERKKFVETAVKLLPLLYLKASLLPQTTSMEMDNLESFVTEDVYEVQRINLSNIMGEQDDYLDSFVTEIEYSDEPLVKDISEQLSDIYQDIKDFVFVFKLGMNETMNEALAKCEENFRTIWGDKLLSVLRALHGILYKDNDEGYEQNSDDEDCDRHHHHE